MIQFQDIAAKVKAANSSSNATLAVATKIKGWLAALDVPVGGIKFNPRGVGAEATSLIPVEIVEGIPVGEPCHYQLEVNGTHQNVRDMQTFIQWFGPAVAFSLFCNTAGWTSDATNADVAKAWG